MGNVWVCSDHHFGHKNIIKYANRPFHDVYEMDKAMIQRHNSVVEDHDKVYFLGDIAFNKKTFHAIMPQLKGKKRLILGNHDELPMQDYMKYFERIRGAWNYKDGDYSFHFTHYPADPMSFNPNGRFYNVHGHIHQNLIGDHRYINVCVEHTNYTPIRVDRLKEIVDNATSK